MNKPYSTSSKTLPWWIALILVLLLVGKASAVQIQDIVRIKGAETSKLVGMGLVVGLPGTGDGGKFAPSMRPLAEVTRRFVDPGVVAAELKDARNVALVTLSAQIPASGVREGDKVDVQVSSVGPAKSLKGGRLFIIPLLEPRAENPRVFAMAEGALTIEDPEVPTEGVIHDGAQLTKDVLSQFMDRQGRLHLIINNDNATWTVSNNIADLINGLMAPDGPPIAFAADQKNVLVKVPEYARTNPAGFISQIMQTYIDPTQVASGARVVINEQTGTIVVTGDVEISPVVISHEGLTITTITPAIPATPQNPRQVQQNWLALDPHRRGGAKLADLIEAFNQLKVDGPDRIEIIKTIAKSGKLHAELIIQ